MSVVSPKTYIHSIRSTEKSPKISNADQVGHGTLIDDNNESPLQMKFSEKPEAAENPDDESDKNLINELKAMHRIYENAETKYKPLPIC